MNLRKLAHMFVGIAALFAAGSVHAQTAKSLPSNFWSPPDRHFTLQVPKRLAIVKDGPGESSDPNAVKTYAVKRGKNAFIVYVLRYKEYSTESTEDKFGGLFFLIGGDDDHDFTEKDLTIDGLPAQEIIYKNQKSRGLFIDAGDTVIVLAMIGTTREDLDSPEAYRFFSTFQLNRNINAKK